MTYVIAKIVILLISDVITYAGMVMVLPQKIFDGSNFNIENTPGLKDTLRFTMLDTVLQKLTDFIDIQLDNIRKILR